MKCTVLLPRKMILVEKFLIQSYTVECVFSISIILFHNIPNSCLMAVVEGRSSNGYPSVTG